jgi:hypothetical protein
VVVLVVALGVELVTPPAEPELVSVELPDVPVLPIELVLPAVPAVPELVEPVEPVPLVDGLVELELVEPVPVEPVEPVVSFLLQALNESAPTTARVAAAHWVKDIFIRKLLEVCWCCE